MMYRYSFALFGLAASLIGCSSTSAVSEPEEVISQAPQTLEEEVVEEKVTEQEMTEQDAAQQEVVEQKLVEQEPKPKSIDGRVLLENEPTRQVLGAIESVTDTLNVLSFGIFAGSRT
ncbi:hypothetical protein [Vibrio paucivorans]